jgi:hypothetical protein
MSRTHDVTISAFDLDRIESELASVTEQRDRLAEALREIANEDYRGYRPQSANIAHKALAAVKGGSDDN